MLQRFNTNESQNASPCAAEAPFQCRAYKTVLLYSSNSISASQACLTLISVFRFFFMIISFRTTSLEGQKTHNNYRDSRKILLGNQFFISYSITLKTGFFMFSDGIILAAERGTNVTTVFTHKCSQTSKLVFSISPCYVYGWGYCMHMTTND